MKPENNRAWFLVLPVLILVAFSAIIPLMTVVNYSVQDIFGPNERYWVGFEWFIEVLNDKRLHDALWRQFLFSGLVLLIEIPLGVLIALAMPKKGWTVSLVLVLIALPLLIPWNVIGTIWIIFTRPDIGLFGAAVNGLGLDFDHTANALDAWVTLMLMEVWHWTPLVVTPGLCRPEVDPGRLLSGRQDRWCLGLGRLPLHPAAQDARRADHRRPASLHGQFS